MPHATPPTPDDRAERLLAHVLAQEPDDGPPAGFVDTVMARLAPRPPSPWFERGLALGGLGALAAAAAWAMATQPALQATWDALPTLPAAPALGWAALALAVQAVLQARRGGVR
jgi:hypothetical protein